MSSSLSSLQPPGTLSFDAVAVVDFWRAAGPTRWFAHDAAFDTEFGGRFAVQHAAAVHDAATGVYADAVDPPRSALGLVLLLDQYPRNAFRDTPRMFATDAAGLAAARHAGAAGFDRQLGDGDAALRVFFYLPFMHSEDLADQERCLALTAPLGGETHRFAQTHHDAIARFGRFPHRNRLLGRSSNAEEVAYLARGGFAG